MVCVTELCCLCAFWQESRICSGIHRTGFQGGLHGISQFVDEGKKLSWGAKKTQILRKVSTVQVFHGLCDCMIGFFNFVVCGIHWRCQIPSSQGNIYEDAEPWIE